MDDSAPRHPPASRERRGIHRLSFLALALSLLAPLGAVIALPAVILAAVADLCGGKASAEREMPRPSCAGFALAILCLASYYLCRTVPLRLSSLAHLAGNVLGAAAISASLWVLAGRGWVGLLAWLGLPSALGRFDPFLANLSVSYWTTQCCLCAGRLLSQASFYPKKPRCARVTFPRGTVAK